MYPTCQRRRARERDTARNGSVERPETVAQWGAAGWVHGIDHDFPDMFSGEVLHPSALRRRDGIAVVPAALLGP